MGEPSSGADVVAVLPAAGSGERLGAGVPKAFVELGGVPMLVRAVDGLLASDVVGHVVVVVPVDQVSGAAALLPGRPVTVVPGGADRTASVAAGLAVTGPDTEVVLVHDAARPLTPPDVVRRVVTAVRAGTPAVIPVLPVSDTVKQVDADGVVVSTVDRSALRAVQTPQGFLPGVLRRAYAGSPDPRTDDAGLVEAAGDPVSTVAGDPLAFKVTTAWDLRIAGLLLAGTAERIG
ncbi:2-C-methyl-D-erythritol 4-phosphate cytidylyltransferase [Pseudonocardia sp. Ae168_Ps1]|uniref:2-C-methyl-D-erythritol 4-phosphate cytidylyltransferase n=1 Tax=unclassified Pseudonocardia TaxID=2619320 RepID=UPI00094B45C2|nr:MULTISPECIES: 2-C-methyl-D-erythritol 4-phosphate cytidylyltransferase [unclassified Pseudonocardia]OLL74688.1 2-C-methyl-D-erythritol 4-phosphate cytidylyltransferase [Pseudonocardia sp. Ae150A_Ps1]OLL80668.1 2-C-methyl-D-erythritol 4-phosphate cytidylyltransferase [Pseudonocardia sp. Ae168_Ps1]OLL85203.1 2-C-methyl-D-erythritol 4-phosphate cytidylyltransferase [Pseudonocardia sp. Ae263_Ps1]OLL94772.1 2-C-methyl-D-erythritol 4-phosphate cytidylyltransferase [Pseudonocardia sp. Ae356_Ps1]